MEYLASFEILYNTILEAKLKLDEKLKKQQRSFPQSENQWLGPRFNNVFGITSEADEEDRDVSPSQWDEANGDVT